MDDNVVEAKTETWQLLWRLFWTLQPKHAHTHQTAWRGFNTKKTQRASFVPLQMGFASTKVLLAVKLEWLCSRFLPAPL